MQAVYIYRPPVLFLLTKKYYRLRGGATMSLFNSAQIARPLKACMAASLIALSSGLPVAAQDFRNGYPADQQEVQNLYDQMDLQRATQAYLWSYPAVSFQSMLQGAQAAGVGWNDMLIADKFGNSNSLFLTANTTTIYAQCNFTLKDGPIVVELPKAPFVGMVDDFWQRSLSDLGLAGPDKSQGAKYFFVPPGYKGAIPAAGYIVIQARQNSHNFMIRGLVQGDDVAGAVAAMKQTKVYPWAAREKPKPNTWFSLTDGTVDTSTPSGLEYWQRLSNFINDNPVEERDRFFMASLKNLGIEKGQPFKPDARQQKILIEGAKLGDAMARVTLFAPRIKGAQVWPEHSWKWAVLLKPDQRDQNYEQLDERLHWFYGAIYMTPAMALKKAGPGSQYIQTFVDSQHNWLDGAHSYTLRIPANIPAKDFWSITLYDAQTRSLVQNASTKPAVSSYDGFKTNPDGSIDLYFGPQAPKGLESNWIETLPGKGFFVWFRAYHPTAGLFDGSWQLSEIEKTQ
jgi:hypothetical protein